MEQATPFPGQPGSASGDGNILAGKTPRQHVIVSGFFPRKSGYVFVFLDARKVPIQYFPADVFYLALKGALQSRPLETEIEPADPREQ